VTSGTVQNYTYTYDRYGNRVSQTALQTGYNFNPTINPVNNHITTSGFTYDAAGNMTNDSVHGYTYDAEGNITKVDGGSTAQYVYDVFNRRIHGQTASGTTEYIYDYAGRRISSWLSPNNYGNEGRIYWDGQQIGYRSADGTTYFDHQDTLGTERMRTNYAKSVGSSYISLPWGDGYTATVNNAGGDQDNLHFAGLERDAESGTEHAQFRNYASAQGRWLAPDSYMGSYDLTNPQSMNRYAYSLNNPASFLDPSGLYSLPPPTTNDNSCTFVDCIVDSGGGGGGTGGGGGNGSGISGQAPPKAPNNPTQPGKQSKSACNAQRAANAIPGATLTGNNTFQGGHEEYGIQVSGADLAGAGFSFYSSPFGNGNGYRTPFSGAHVNGQPGNIAIPYAYGETFAGQAHFDVGNASSGFGGFAEHSFVDVLLGTLLGWIPGLHNFLDPGC
jgi:RHS repeat-associated protein